MKTQLKMVQIKRFLILHNNKTRGQQFQSLVIEQLSYVVKDPVSFPISSAISACCFHQLPLSSPRGCQVPWHPVERKSCLFLPFVVDPWIDSLNIYFTYLLFRGSKKLKTIFSRFLGSQNSGCESGAANYMQQRETKVKVRWKLLSCHCGDRAG